MSLKKMVNFRMLAPTYPIYYTMTLLECFPLTIIRHPIHRIVYDIQTNLFHFFFVANDPLKIIPLPDFSAWRDLWPLIFREVTDLKF